MNEQKRDVARADDATTRAAQDARGCDRAEDLVAHLYGEATPEEDAGFRRHLHACAVCRDELAAFRGLRELVSAERAHVLGAAPALGVRELLARDAGEVNEVHAVNEADAASPRPTPPRRRSAAAAFREFFALSPPWLRAGAAACALLVCALAALTVARAEVRWDADGIAFRTVGGGDVRVVEKTVEVPVQTGFTREQLEALVAERLKDEREAMSHESLEGRGAATAPTADAKNVRKQSAPRVLSAAGPPRTQQRRRAAPSGARRDERQLDEDDLPRLSDLLGSAY